MTRAKVNSNGNGKAYETIAADGNAYWQRATKDEQLRLRGKFSGKKSFFGHKTESQAGKIDNCVLAGRFTIAEIAAIACFKSGRVAESRVKQHLYAKLRDKRDINIQIDKQGRVYAANNAESAENNRLLNKAEAEAAEAVAAGKIRHIAKVKRLQKIDKKLKAAK